MNLCMRQMKFDVSFIVCWWRRYSSNDVSSSLVQPVPVEVMSVEKIMGYGREDVHVRCVLIISCCGDCGAGGGCDRERGGGERV